MIKNKIFPAQRPSKDAGNQCSPCFCYEEPSNARFIDLEYCRCYQKISFLCHACQTYNIVLSVPVESTLSKQSIKTNFLLLQLSILISRRYIMQWMTLPISFHYFLCKGYLLANNKDKCLALSPGTSGCSSNTPYIFTWITWVVKKYYMIHSSEVNSPRSSVTSCHNELFVTRKRNY